jgi:hypothetical protein
MAYDVRTPRRRGSLCGLALILLGGWGGVAPFAGPSLRFGFTPDTAWAYTQGRLYLSALPGAVVLVAGLIVLVTRSRGFGGFCALVAAFAGGWFIAGAALVRLLPARQAASIVTGSPLGTGTSRIVLTSLAFFGGTGALIVFFAALALGRFSLAAYQDQFGLANDPDGMVGLVAAPPALLYGPDQDTQGYPHSPYFAGQTQDYPAQYPASDPFGTAQQQYPSQDPFGLTHGGRSWSPFPPAPKPFPPGPPFPASQSPFPPAPDPSAPSQQDPASPAP